MPFLPLGDDNQRRYIATPWVTWGLMFACFVIFIYQEGLDGLAYGEFIYGVGLIPGVLLGEAEMAPQLWHLPAPVTLLSYQFLHGGWDHLLGNMLFLWIFGDNVEDAMGHRRFLVFYLLGGVAAGLAHALLDPGSAVPLIGASGAISAVLGAYLLLHPFSRIVVLVVLLPLRLPAWVLLVVWFGFQFVALNDAADDGVAWVAHIAGFLAGAAGVALFKHRDARLWQREPPVRVIAVGRFRRRPRSAPSGGQASREERRGGPGPWG